MAATTSETTRPTTGRYTTMRDSTVKWYATGEVNGSGEPDCSAQNEATAECSPVEVHVARQSLTNGAQTGRTLTLTRGQNCS